MKEMYRGSGGSGMHGFMRERRVEHVRPRNDRDGEDGGAGRGDFPSTWTIHQTFYNPRDMSILANEFKVSPLDENHAK